MLTCFSPSSSFYFSWSVILQSRDLEASICQVTWCDDIFRSTWISLHRSVILRWEMRNFIGFVNMIQSLPLLVFLSWSPEVFICRVAWCDDIFRSSLAVFPSSIIKWDLRDFILWTVTRKVVKLVCTILDRIIQWNLFIVPLILLFMTTTSLYYIINQKCCSHGDYYSLLTLLLLSQRTRSTCCF